MCCILETPLAQQHATEAFRRSIFDCTGTVLTAAVSAGGKPLRPPMSSAIPALSPPARAELNDAGCPRILGIDELFFSRRHGYANTFCDLAKHKVYDVVLGRSEAA
jgi:transposase